MQPSYNGSCSQQLYVAIGIPETLYFVLYIILYKRNYFEILNLFPTVKNFEWQLVCLPRAATSKSRYNRSPQRNWYSLEELEEFQSILNNHQASGWLSRRNLACQSYGHGSNPASANIPDGRGESLYFCKFSSRETRCGNSTHKRALIILHND